MSDTILPEEELIAFIKPRLKALGFKKKGKRWTRVSGDFTQVFFIQGSSFSKDLYYIRPGVFINDCPEKEFYYYGHFYTEIRQTNPQQVLDDTLSFFGEWTDRDFIIARAKAFVEWEKRNPLEKRRAGEVDYETDPVPSGVFFGIRPCEMEYILNVL